MVDLGLNYQKVPEALWQEPFGTPRKGSAGATSFLCAIP